jgi:hypothetical protein
MEQKSDLKPIDLVTVDRLQLVMSAIGMNFTDKELDAILDAVELIEDNAGNVTLNQIQLLKADHDGTE